MPHHPAIQITKLKMYEVLAALIIIIFRSKTWVPAQRDLNEMKSV
jgi:hypothetical protein